MWNIASVYSSKIATQWPRLLTHPLTLANPAYGSIGPSSRLSLTVGFPRLLLTALSCWLPCSVLLSSVLLWDLAFLVFFRSRRRSRALALCVGFAPKQTRNLLTGIHSHSHPQKRTPVSCHTLLEWLNLWISSTKVADKISVGNLFPSFLPWLISYMVRRVFFNRAADKI